MNDFTSNQSKKLEREESDIFAIFPVEVTKISIATNFDFFKNLLEIITRLSWFDILKSIKIVAHSLRFSESRAIKIQESIGLIESPKNIELLDGSKNRILIPLS